MRCLARTALSLSIGGLKPIRKRSRRLMERTKSRRCAARITCIRHDRGLGRTLAGIALFDFSLARGSHRAGEENYLRGDLSDELRSSLATVVGAIRATR